MTPASAVPVAGRPGADQDGSPDVLVIGGGLSGLACAVRLHEAGRSVRVLEGSDRPGGRVRTDIARGFRLDRGFQTLLTSYPEARDQLDLQALDLRPFHSGAIVRRGGRFVRLADPRRHPTAAWGSLTAPVGTLADRWRIARLDAFLRRHLAAGRGGTTSAEALAAAGLSQEMIDAFLRPFLAGVFLEPDLRTPARHLAFVWSMFARGRAALPAHGMEAIPAQLAARLPAGAIRCGTHVQDVTSGAVTLTSGETLRADAIVLAADVSSAARLLPAVPDHAWHGVTCVSYEAAAAPVRGPWLVLDGDGDGPVNNLCVPSQVASSYAPPGRQLVSVSVLGVDEDDDERLDHAIRRQLTGWFGAAVGDWGRLRVERVRRALPVVGAAAAPEPSLPEGVSLCGDHLDTPSIHGALGSGRRAAEAVLARV